MLANESSKETDEDLQITLKVQYTRINVFIGELRKFVQASCKSYDVLGKVFKLLRKMFQIQIFLNNWSRNVCRKTTFAQVWDQTAPSDMVLALSLRSNESG